MTSRIVRTQTEAGNGTSSPVPPLRSNSGSGAVGCGRDGICGGCTVGSSCGQLAKRLRSAVTGSEDTGA